jgi:hypothetical protein
MSHPTAKVDFELNSLALLAKCRATLLDPSGKNAASNLKKKMKKKAKKNPVIEDTGNLEIDMDGLDLD